MGRKVRREDQRLTYSRADLEDFAECSRTGQSLFHLWNDRKTANLIVRKQRDYFIKVMLPF